MACPNCGNVNQQKIYLCGVGERVNEQCDACRKSVKTTKKVILKVVKKEGQKNPSEK